MIVPSSGSYKSHQMQRILFIDGIVSADLVLGIHSDTHHHDHKDAWEMVYSVKGTTKILKGHDYHSLPAGRILFIAPGIPHDSLTNDPDARALFISFTCAADCLNILREPILNVTRQIHDIFMLVIDELYSCYELNEGELRLFTFTSSTNTPVGAEQMICCYLEQAMICILREMTKSDGQVVPMSHFETAANEFLIKSIQDYISEHIKENISVQSIAEIFHYSRSRLTTLCKEVTGHGLNDMITSQRIALAKELLSKNELTITQIAEVTGFGSPQYFSRRFSQVAGCSPTEFCRQYHMN